MIDWRKILVAYIGHVIDHESVTYLPGHIGGTAVETDLTEAERAALLVAEKEAWDRRRREEAKP
jgi:hypothetical protein